MSQAPRDLAVAFKTLGCKVNRVESDTIAADLLGRGCRVVSEDEAAVIVVNTCTVTGEADAKARKAVRHALKAVGQPVVVVTGCLAAIDAEALRALGERVIVEADKAQVAVRVAEALGETAEGALQANSAPTIRTGEGFRVRVPVKVQDGCDNFCTYCIVPYARGVPRSRPAADVVAEVEALVAEGVCEVVLTGINIGKYSVPEAPALPQLCTMLAEETDVSRIRISSIEAPDFGPDFLQAMASAPQIVEHFHVPLQSGSSRVLGEMGRTYTAEQFAEILIASRTSNPRITYTTDVICGFPGETEEDHQATMALCEQVGFSKLHVFRYSPRKGTPAAEMPNQIPAEVKARRAAETRELDAELRQRFIESRLGTTVEVLVEKIENGIAEGTTREYLRVRVPAGRIIVGETVAVTLTPEMLGG